MKCPFCENDKFESGRFQGPSPLKFKSSRGGFLDDLVMWGSKKTVAKRCTKCGFVAIFADDRD